MGLISNCPAEIYNQTLVVTFDRDACIHFVVLNNGNASKESCNNIWRHLYKIKLKHVIKKRFLWK